MSTGADLMRLEDVGSDGTPWCRMCHSLLLLTTRIPRSWWQGARRPPVRQVGSPCRCAGLLERVSQRCTLCGGAAMHGPCWCGWPEQGGVPVCVRWGFCCCMFVVGDAPSMASLSWFAVVCAAIMLSPGFESGMRTIARHVCPSAGCDSALETSLEGGSGPSIITSTPPSRVSRPGACALKRAEKTAE